MSRAEQAVGLSRRRALAGGAALAAGGVLAGAGGAGGPGGASGGSAQLEGPREIQWMGYQSDPVRQGYFEELFKARARPTG